MKPDEFRDTENKKEALIRFYEMGREICWAKTLNKNYYPLNKLYKNRMLDAISMIRININHEAEFTLLDAGCGIGIYSINILKEYPRSTVFAFDVSKEQIDFINQKLGHNLIGKQCFFFKADIDDFDLKDLKVFGYDFGNKLDFIMCTEVLEHLPNPEMAFSNLYKSGDEHTKFIFSVPTGYSRGKSWWFFYQPGDKNKVIMTQDFSKISPNKEYYRFYHKTYSYEEFVEVLTHNGFKILQTKFANLSFKNRYLDYGYSLFGMYKFDKLLNKLTLNRFCSQVTVLCKKYQMGK